MNADSGKPGSFTLCEKKNQLMNLYKCTVAMLPQVWKIHWWCETTDI